MLTSALFRFSLVAAALALGSTAAAQRLDSPKADPTHHKVELENDAVRVIRYIIPPNDTTALHDHPAHVNVVLTDGHLELTGQDGKKTEVNVKAGAASWRNPVVHTAKNLGEKPIEGILIEPKGAANAGWKPPARDAVIVTPHDKVEFENEHVRIVRFSYGKGESSPMHDHPAGVIVLLSDGKARLVTPDGKASEASGRFGTVMYRPAASHAFENVGDTFEGIHVDLKGAPAGK